MITLISNIVRKNDGFLVTTTAVSSTENNTSSTGIGVIASDENGIKNALYKTINTSAAAAVRSVSDSMDKRAFRNLGDTEELNSLAQKDTEINNLKQVVSSRDSSIRRLQDQFETLRRDHENYRVQVQKDLQAIQNSNGEVVTLTTPAIAPSLGSNTIVLNAKMLNDAIQNGEKLESRTCCQCKSLIIAPISVHENEIVCAKCRPQGIDQLAQLNPVTNNPFEPNNNNYNDDDYDNEDDPCRDCDGDCENCEHND